MLPARSPAHTLPAAGGNRIRPDLLAIIYSRPDGEVQVPVPFSEERRRDQPEALLSYIEKRIKQAVVSGEQKPRVGFFVRVLSSEDLADIYHWREVLEREAFRMAIPRLTGDDIEEMRRLCGQMRKLTAPAARREYLTLNRQFHFIAFRRAGSDRLLRFLTYLWDVAAPYT